MRIDSLQPQRLVLILVLALSIVAQVRAEPLGHEVSGAIPDACKDLRAGDELWMVDTHGFGCGASPDDLRIYRWQQGWQSTDVSTFWKSDIPLTTVYVHGNRADPSKATHRGRLLYKNFLATDGRPPVRLVIWAWPSERVQGAIRDVRAKARRADVEAGILAQTLERFTGGTQISLIGYSFGARIISGAMHQIQATPDQRTPIRAAFIAGAVDRNWLRRGFPHSRALDQLESLMVLYNPCDPALARYRVVDRKGLLDRNRNAIAVGARGLNHGADRVILEQRNVSQLIGKSHEEERYYHARPLFAPIGSFLMWQR